MVFATSLVYWLGTLSLLFETANQLKIPSLSDNIPSEGIETRQADGIKPLYLTAHKVLTEDGVDAAIKHGANGFEIDMTAWDEGWWADHDGRRDPPSWYSKAGDLFKHIAKRASDREIVQMVWLDIKNPNYCDLDDAKWEVCSIKGLMELARENLGGVAVLYGFMNADGKAFQYVKHNLKDNEAINYDGSGFHGSPNKTPRETNEELLDVPKSQKVASYGDDLLREGFGDCHEASWNTCTELRMAAESGNYTKTLGWTIVEGQGDLVEKLFGEAGVDGVIHGHENDIYNDDQWTRAAADSIKGWIKNHPETKIADANDPAPW